MNATEPRIIRLATDAAMVESETHPGTFYETRMSGCSCPAFHFKAQSNPCYRCKHQVAANLVYRCVNCATEVVPGPCELCQHCGPSVAEYAPRAFACPCCDVVVGREDTLCADCKRQYRTALA